MEASQVATKKDEYFTRLITALDHAGDFYHLLMRRPDIDAFIKKVRFMPATAATQQLMVENRGLEAEWLQHLVAEAGPKSGGYSETDWAPFTDESRDWKTSSAWEQFQLWRDGEYNKNDYKAKKITKKKQLVTLLEEYGIKECNSRSWARAEGKKSLKVLRFPKAKEMEDALKTKNVWV